MPFFTFQVLSKSDERFPGYGHLIEKLGLIHERYV